MTLSHEEIAKVRAAADQTMAQINSGHGHVFPRRDGMKARCGGPGLCSECSKDKAARDRSMPDRPTVLALCDMADRTIEIEATMAKLREGLEPFVFGSAQLEAVLFDGLPDEASGTMTITLGAMRRARQLLSETAKP